MKRSLFLAVSVIALTVVADQLLAAEAEAPAPSERAAPAARERAPARERAVQRAPQRAPVQRQAASQSPASSFTGTQAGGFGGGNAGGGGNADPAFCGFGQFDPGCGTSTQNIGRKSGFLGGAELGQMFPIGGYFAAGWAVDVFGNTLRSEGSDQFTRVVPSSSSIGAGNIIHESFTTSQTQPVGTTWRLKLGVSAWPGTMIYATGGGAGAMVHGDFNYNATTQFCDPSSQHCTASATNSYEKFKAGYTAGGGVTFAFPGSPGAITVEYLYTNLGRVDQTILVTSPGSPFAGVAQTSMKTDTSAVRVKFSWGL